MCAGAVRSALVKIPGVVDADQTKVTKDDESAVVLVKKGLVAHKYLAEIYQSFDLSNTKDAGDDNLALLERIKIFKDIRKTSSQADLVNKIPKYVSLFSAHGMLENASLMIYDKIKIVQPKDIIIVMGAGDIWRECDNIYEVLNK